MPTANDATLTLTNHADLLARAATVHYARASIRVQRVPNFGAPGSYESRFVMEGPSGSHSLLVAATDLERLNAHWTVFATDPRNAHIN